MSAIPVGLSFDETEDGFIIRQKDFDGKVAEIKLSEEDFWGLKGTIALWSDRILAHRQAGSGSVQALVVHPVAQVQLAVDVLQQDVLLTIVAPTGAQMVLAFPPHIAAHIAAEIPGILEEMAGDDPSRQ